ncbi:LPS-assembly protein LptD [Candidatus Pelagibacter giovannonii]|uniref:LPS-assembly protein LptD n=1 Tax=Candidatus Pelagibacter giovannonii TaxID=2563896 RepID=A0A6H1Q337_9PROT|nr:LPS-assembly protein LptD [Candidatus Pelagibacter giovannonii]QIZ20655.1 LPS-assembly protein LptD [Candidatus Pelagibacter giovannonii]
MKNKFATCFLVIIFTLCNLSKVLGEEFIFEVSDLEIVDNGNTYKGNNRGTIRTDSQLKLISDNFEYLKKINRLEANGNVQLFDLNNDISINAQQIFYLKNEEKIFTLGKTLIKISNKYDIEGFDLIFFKNKMILSSKKNAIITDSESNTYKLEQFQYSIDKEILKGENIVAITNDKKNKSDEFSFKTGFFDLKKNKFLGKNIIAKFHKNLFGNNENDPRISAVSGYGNKFNTYFEKGVFTSCKKTDKCPPWKITSNKIHHDKIKKQITYKNAWLEVYDFPVAYFPKFFHPDPTVERQSGFLKPEFGSSDNLGGSVYMPYFIAISDDKDLTIKPRLFGDNKFLLQSEYRLKTKNSLTISDFSFVNGHDSSTQDKGDTRSHLFTNTLVDLSLDNFRKSMLQVQYQKVSNDNYLKVFDLQSPLLLDDNSVLETKIELDLEHENYDLTTSFEMYETLEGSNSDRYQYVLPSYDFSKNYIFENIKGSFNFNSYGDNTLNDTNVATSSISNDLNYSALNKFFDNGIKTNFEVALKNINTVGKNNPTYKNSPQSELMSAYTYNASLPLIKKNPKTFNTLEPKLSLRLSPHEMKNNSNESRRIDVSNIFSSNRLSLGNSFEAGESITLGLNFKKEKVNTSNKINEIEEYIDFKLASVFRLDEEKNIPTNSTLNKKNSNIFGQFNFKPVKNISLGYNFSLTEDLNTFEYSSLITQMEFGNFVTQFDYLEERGVVGSTNIIKNTTKYNFDDQNSILFNTRRNRKLDLTEYYDLIYEYKNDCLVAGIKYRKNYYNDADIKPVEELFFSITIVPLGTFSPDKMALK